MHSELLKKIKKKLKELYGDRFEGLVLFGSYSRGDFDSESDIDLLCLLKGPVNTAREVSPIVDCTYSIQLEYPDIIFHIYAVDSIDFENGSYPLCATAKEEGTLV
jgi:predicted nucleotidyltransferase